MDYFPIFLRLTGEPVLVVGGGQVAARKVDLLLRAGAKVTVVSPGLCATLSDCLAARLRPAADGRLIHLAEEFRPEHLEGMRLAVAATNRESVNNWVAVQAERLGVPVNVVDDRVRSRFIIPAIVDRSPVMVAVSSGGSAPVLTRRLRERLETLLPESLGVLARIAGRWRGTVKKRLSDASARRRFWENFFDGSLAADVLAGRVKNVDGAGGVDSATHGSGVTAGVSAATIARALSQAALRGMPTGEVTLVGAAPGDPGLLTLRGLRALQDADVVLYDKLVSDEVLDLARRDAERIYVGKSAGGERVAQDEINAMLVKLALEGKRVCRLKGGDPFIFGRGGEELEALARAGVAFQVVPGITAATGCAAYAGIPLTHRDHSRVLTFVTGHAKVEAAAAVPPATPAAPPPVAWEALSRPGHTLVVYMGLGGLRSLLDQLRTEGVPADRAAAVVEQGTRATQRVFIGTLATLADDIERAGVRSPALLIVGEVTRLHELLHWFESERPVSHSRDDSHGSSDPLAGFSLHRKLSA